jgi:hypothetical protein
MSQTEALSLHPTEDFLPVPTSPAYSCTANGYELVDQTSPAALKLGTVLDRDLTCRSGIAQLAVVRWMDPLSERFQDIPAYPDELRRFRPVPDPNPESVAQAMDVLQNYGPLVPYPRSRYRGSLLREVEDRNSTVVSYEVPEHQGRGFIHPQVYTFRIGDRIVHKLVAATKGNGITGYWHDKKQSEVITALQEGQSDMPTNPDVFHARDHTGQSVGQKRGDEIVWVGLASDHVTAREVAGFDILSQTGVFTPLCLPVERFDQLPLATGEVIDVGQFKDGFDSEANLVYLAKTWANETRVWGNVISRNYNMTAAHLLSARDGDTLGFEKVIADLQATAPQRRFKLDQEKGQMRRILGALEPNEWQEVFGQAGAVLADKARQLGKEAVIADTDLSTVMSINMLQNIVSAGSHRVYGKPVSWHLENVGLWGEVSGGERIYGQAAGSPQSMEFHSLFAYLFDGYTATAAVFAAEGKQPPTIEDFYMQARQGILRANSGHWVGYCGQLDDFVSLCQQSPLDYNVAFRAADTYPLVAVNATDPSCISSQDTYWKDWRVLRRNLGQFISGIKEAYNTSNTNR